MNHSEEVREGAVKKNYLLSLAIIAMGLFIILILLAIFIRVFCCTLVDNYEHGFYYDKFQGKIKVLERTGYFIYNPIRYSYHTIDCRPQQISITAGGTSGTTTNSSDISSRVLNAKLVSFNPAGLSTFITAHGRDAGDSIENLRIIMRCYAFDITGGKYCPFITISSEISPIQLPITK